MLENSDIVAKLVDVRTKDIVGYMVSYDTISEGDVVNCRIPLTKEKMVELNVPCADDAEFFDLDTIDVISCNGSFVYYNEEKFFNTEYEDTPLRFLQDGSVSIYGYLYKFYELVKLDNDLSISKIVNCLI